MVWSGAPWSFVAGEGQGKWGAASLELQLRASTPTAPENLALIPNPQSLVADPPTQGPWMGRNQRGIRTRQNGGVFTVCRSWAD